MNRGIRQRRDDGNQKKSKTGVKQAVPYRTGREALCLSVSTDKSKQSKNRYELGVAGSVDPTRPPAGGDSAGAGETGNDG